MSSSFYTVKLDPSNPQLHQNKSSGSLQGERLDGKSLFNYSFLFLISNQLYYVKTGVTWQGSAQSYCLAVRRLQVQTPAAIFVVALHVWFIFSGCYSFHPYMPNRSFRLISDYKQSLRVNSCLSFRWTDVFPASPQAPAPCSTAQNNEDIMDGWMQSQQQSLL